MFKWSFITIVILISIGAAAFMRVSDTENSPDPEITEHIRRRVENISINNSLQGTEKIYAARSVKDIYTSNEFRALWNKQAEIVQFISEIEHASEEGLNPDDYHLRRITALSGLPILPPEQRAELDILLTDAYLLYASHLLSGKVDPVSLNAGWHVTRKEGDPVALFNATIRTNNYNASIRSLVPENAGYESMKRLLASYREIAQQGGWGTIPTGVTITRGMTDPRIPLIRQRLSISGEYPGMKKGEQGKVEMNKTDVEKSGIEKDETGVGGFENMYTEVLEDVIRMYQKRQGFPGDGKIDDPTINALNVTVEERIRQLEINMERWRWLPREFSDYYLLVNIADFELQIYRNGKVTNEFRIIAGKPARKTPVFSSKVSYLVFNPTWTIPPTILNQDVLPEVRKSTSYLTSKNIRVFDERGHELNVDSVNWLAAGVNRYVFRQDPGPANALGAVKFMFPNEFNIYIHDTPGRELFNRSQRAFSSGCIRVENPLRLAEILLDDPKTWNQETMKKLVATRETKTVNLKVRPDVHVLYWTCWVKDDLPYFRKDIYERDEAVYAALKSKPVIDS